MEMAGIYDIKIALTTLRNFTKTSQSSIVLYNIHRFLTGVLQNHQFFKDVTQFSRARLSEVTTVDEIQTIDSKHLVLQKWNMVRNLQSGKTEQMLIYFSS